MLCLALGLLICAVIGGIIRHKFCYSDLTITILGVIVYGLLIGVFTGYIMSIVAPTKIIEYSKTYEISPVEKNSYVISDSNKYIVRQNGKLIDVSRDIAEIKKTEHSEITYFYEEKSYKEPWRTLMAPIETKPVTTVKSILIETKGGI